MSAYKQIQVMGNRVRLLQPNGGFHTSIDAVLLAAACPAQSGQKVIDLGCGVGAAGFCVLERVKGASLTGIDIQEDHIELARQNAVLNNIGDKAQFFHASINDYDPPARFHHVICNPPYLEDGTHTRSPSAPRAKALGHDETTLEDWITAAFNLIKGQGSLTLIHRADHIDRIIAALGKRFGGIEIIPLWPKEGIQAKRVILRCAKHKKTPATLHAGIVLHQENGDYTPEAENILRGGAAIL